MMSSNFYLRTVVGNEYEFEMFPIGCIHEFIKQQKCGAGVLLFLQYNPHEDIPRYILCTITDNLAFCVASSVNLSEVERAGADKFCFYTEPSELVRNEVISDIKENFRFVLN